MPSLRSIAALACIAVATASGCAGTQSGPNDRTAADRQPTTGTRIAGGNPALKVVVINREEIDETGANSVAEVLRRKVVSR